MWLEIDGEEIIGVHSDRCDNPRLWVEYDGEARPGDRWQQGQVMARDRDTSRDRRILARARIAEMYPLWEQLNVLRSGDRGQIDRMGRFIDRVRAWSNNPGSRPEELRSIHP